MLCFGRICLIDAICKKLMRQKEKSEKKPDDKTCVISWIAHSSHIFIFFFHNTYYYIVDFFFFSLSHTTILFYINNSMRHWNTFTQVFHIYSAHVDKHLTCCIVVVTIIIILFSDGNNRVQFMRIRTSARLFPKK